MGKGWEGCNLAKSVRVNDKELCRVLEAGADYLIVGNRRFLLVEVDEPGDGDFYDVTDPDEVRALDAALQDKSPVRRGTEARQRLRTRLKEHGVR
ncbi:MAG TPA: hypothetical protein VNT75_01810 [Symbiobacteriaceae bacterium]|nr:hypothetical protein [Symbiobacteriaceae bacterium]